MNALSFAAKRAHLDLMLLNRGALNPLRITPARLDMLQAIRARFDGCQTQGQLAALLGVTRQTVGRMSRSLEALGLVVCERTEPDRRRVYISLTRAGHTLLNRVHRIYLRSGLAGLAAAFALRDSSRQPEKTSRFVEMARSIRAGLSKWAPFTPESIAAERWDDGAALVGDDRRIFTVVTQWLFARFSGLPVDYVFANSPPFST
ncbi:MAG: MarR family transcriptional regulator [Myxococcales bacterium]|nr:MarR family transcriptional regulator [Myxococcales bacterium]